MEGPVLRTPTPGPAPGRGGKKPLLKRNSRAPSKKRICAQRTSFKVRISLKCGFRLDIYWNPRTKRYDYTLIKGRPG